MLVREILNRTNNGLDWLQAYYGKQFRKDGKGWRSKDGKVSLRMGDAYGEPCWFGVDFTGKYEDGSPFTIISKEKGLRGKDVIQFLADELNLSGGDLANWKPVPIRKEEKPEFPYLVNNDRNKTPSVSYTYEISPEPITGYPKNISPNTLSRYGVKPLAWIEHSKGYRTTATESDPLFLFSAGGNTKIYKPKGFSGSGGKQRPGTYLGNYCFGYDQLPESCEYILLTAGQNDTLAANDILNESGIYAVCLWSEGSEKYLSPELLQDLQSRCKSVFVAYDNDETGNRTASAISDKFGIAAIQIPHKYGENDICDLLDAGISEDRIKADVLRFVHLQESAGKDPFELSIHQEVVQIGRYISSDSAACSRLEKFIFENERTQLLAPTGSGKTTFIFEKLRGLIATVEQPIIFAVPTQTLAEQVAESHSVPVIMQGIDEYDLQACEHSDVIVCTYDSLPKLEGFIPNCSALIFDESHHLVADCSKGFKFNTVNRAFLLSQMARRTLLLSATPIQGMGRLGFKFICLEQAETTPMIVHPVELGKHELADVMQNILTTTEKGKTDVVLWDSDTTESKSKLVRLRRLLVRSGKFKESEIAIISAKRKKDNHVLTQIKADGTIPAGVKVILTTRLIAEGVNIYGKEFGSVHLVNVQSEEIFVQFPARFRDMEEKHVYSYRKDWKEPEYIYQTNEAIQASYDKARTALISAKINYSGKRGQDQLKARYRSGNDTFDLLFHDGEKLVISDLAILHEEMKRRDRSTTPSAFYERISRKYDYITIASSIESDCKLDETTAAAIKAEEREVKQAENQAYRKIIQAPIRSLSYAVIDLARDAEQVGIDPESEEVRAQAENIREENPEFKEFGITLPFRRLHRLVYLGFNPNQAALLIGENRALRTNRGFGAFESKLFVQLAIDDESISLSQTDNARICRLRAVRDALRPLVGLEMGKDELTEAVTLKIQEATGFHPGKLAMKYARELFIVESRRLPALEDGTRPRSYSLSRELTLSDLVGDGVNLSSFRQKSRIRPENDEKQKTQLIDNQACPPLGVLNKESFLISNAGQNK